MNTNALMTVGAIAFAGWAVWKTTRKAGNAVASQPAQRQRDADLASWHDLLSSQDDTFTAVVPSMSGGFGTAVQVPVWWDQNALANTFKP